MSFGHTTRFSFSNFSLVNYLREFLHKVLWSLTFLYMKAFPIQLFAVRGCRFHVRHTSSQVNRNPRLYDWTEIKTSKKAQFSIFTQTNAFFPQNWTNSFLPLESSTDNETYYISDKEMAVLVSKWLHRMNVDKAHKSNSPNDHCPGPWLLYSITVQMSGIRCHLVSKLKCSDQISLMSNVRVERFFSGSIQWAWCFRNVAIRLYKLLT